jgi:hypothetical protein
MCVREFLITPSACAHSPSCVSPQVAWKRGKACSVQLSIHVPSLIGWHNDRHPVPRLQLSQFQMMDAQEVFGCITPEIAKFMPWEPPSWSEYVTRCEKECGLQNRISFLSSFGGSTVVNALAWLPWKMRILFRPSSSFGSRKALRGRVLVGRSSPHLLSGDTRLWANELSPIQ